MVLVHMYRTQGALQGTVTPRQGGDAGSSSYPSLLQYMLADIVVAIPAVDLRRWCEGRGVVRAVWPIVRV
jgi:hypothetical protein